MPTAEEFLESYHRDSKDSLLDGVMDAMIEFAKLHVQEALKSVLNNAKLEKCGNPYDPTDNSQCINEESILNSYSLDKIK